jgi:hypothetical protein
LNPIEMVWNRMKDWIQEQFDDKLYSYDALRVAITAAWEAIDEGYLTELLESMPQRCQAVIAADGNHTRY